MTENQIKKMDKKQLFETAKKLGSQVGNESFEETSFRLEFEKEYEKADLYMAIAIRFQSLKSC
jgi:hypothetical protein